MTLQRMEHVGIVVDDLAAAIDFFVELGPEVQGRFSVEGPWVDRMVALSRPSSRTSTPSSPACGPAAGSWSASW